MFRQTENMNADPHNFPHLAQSLTGGLFLPHLWCVFDNEKFTVHTEAALSYINFCVGNVTVEKHICVLPNQKPWMTSHVKTLPRTTNSAFRSGNRELYSADKAY